MLIGVIIYQNTLSMKGGMTYEYKESENVLVHVL